MWEEWGWEKAFHAKTVACGNSIRYTQTVHVIDYHISLNGAPSKAPSSLSSSSALIQTRPDIRDRKKPVTAKNPLRTQTHCMEKSPALTHYLKA